MSRYEEDDCETTRQLKLREINRKALRASNQTCEGLECTEIPIEEVLHYANNTDSKHSDTIRNEVIKKLITDEE